MNGGLGGQPERLGQPVEKTLREWSPRFLVCLFAVGRRPKRWRATRTPRRWRVRRMPRRREASGSAPALGRFGPNGRKRPNHPASASPSLCHMHLAYSRHYNTREEKTDVPEEPFCTFFEDFFSGREGARAGKEKPLILLIKNGVRRWEEGRWGGRARVLFHENP